jgi:hypothetical protein
VLQKTDSYAQHHRDEEFADAAIFTALLFSFKIRFTAPVEHNSRSFTVNVVTMTPRETHRENANRSLEVKAAVERTGSHPADFRAANRLAGPLRHVLQVPMKRKQARLQAIGPRSFSLSWSRGTTHRQKTKVSCGT